MALELTKLKKADEARWMDLLDPETDEPLGVRFLLAGVDSDVYRKTSRDIQTRRMTRTAGRTKPRPEELSKLVEEEASNLLASCVMDWDGLLEEGAPLPCTRANVEKILNDPKLGWIREAVDKFIGDRRNFLQD